MLPRNRNERTRPLKAVLISVAVHVALVGLVVGLVHRGDGSESEVRPSDAAFQGQEGGAAGMARRTAIQDPGLPLTESEARRYAGTYLLTHPSGQSFRLAIEAVNESSLSREFWTLIADDSTRRQQPLRRTSDSVFVYSFNPAISITFRPVGDSTASLVLRLPAETVVGERIPEN